MKIFPFAVLCVRTLGLLLVLSCVELATATSRRGEPKDVFRRELSFRLQSKHWFTRFGSLDDLTDEVFETLFEKAITDMNGQGDEGGFFCADIPWWQGWLLKPCLDVIIHLEAFPQTQQDIDSLSHADQAMTKAFAQLQENYEKDYNLEWIYMPRKPQDLVALEVSVQVVEALLPLSRRDHISEAMGNSTLDNATNIVAVSMFDRLNDYLPRANGECSWSFKPADTETKMHVEVYTNNIQGTDCDNEMARDIVTKNVETINRSHDWFVVKVLYENGESTVNVEESLIPIQLGPRKTQYFKGKAIIQAHNSGRAVVERVTNPHEIQRT